MAKKQTPIEPIPTELILSKIQFASVLDEQIAIGAEIFNRRINTQPEFAAAREAYSDWYDYNSEYLKQAFSKEYNEYKKDFDDAGSFMYSAMGGRNLTPNEELEKFRNKVSRKIDSLKKLKAKTGLLKSSFPDILLTNSDETVEKAIDKSMVFPNLRTGSWVN
jgi:hypothetical protein